MSSTVISIFFSYLRLSSFPTQQTTFLVSLVSFVITIPRTRQHDFPIHFIDIIFFPSHRFAPRECDFSLCHHCQTAAINIRRNVPRLFFRVPRVFPLWKSHSAAVEGELKHKIQSRWISIRIHPKMFCFSHQTGIHRQRIEIVSISFIKRHFYVSQFPSSFLTIRTLFASGDENYQNFPFLFEHFSIFSQTVTTYNKKNKIKWEILIFLLCMLVVENKKNLLTLQNCNC